MRLGLEQEKYLCMLNRLDAFKLIKLEQQKQVQKGLITYKSDFILNESRLVKIDIPFNHFEATRRGEPYPSAPEIDLKNITSIGIRIIGRADINLRQKGVFALQLKKFSFQ